MIGLSILNWASVFLDKFEELVGLRVFFYNYLRLLIDWLLGGPVYLREYP